MDSADFLVLVHPPVWCWLLVAAQVDCELLLRSGVDSEDFLVLVGWWWLVVVQVDSELSLRSEVGSEDSHAPNHLLVLYWLSLVVSDWAGWFCRDLLI